MNIRHVLTTLAGILIAMASIAGTACLLVTMQEDNSVWGLILLEGVIAIILHILAIVKVKRGSFIGAGLILASLALGRFQS